MRFHQVTIYICTTGINWVAHWSEWLTPAQDEPKILSSTIGAVVVKQASPFLLQQAECRANRFPPYQAIREGLTASVFVFMDSYKMCLYKYCQIINIMLFSRTTLAFCVSSIHKFSLNRQEVPLQACYRTIVNADHFLQSVNLPRVIGIDGKAVGSSCKQSFEGREFGTHGSLTPSSICCNRL